MLKKPLKRRFTLNSSTFSVSFIGVSLLVLVIFMCQPHASPGITVDRPKVDHPKTMPKADREDAMVVAVFRDGTIFFNNDKLSADQLTRGIRERVSKGAERKVYIKADARAKVGSVSEVLDGIRASGIENIAFLVDQRKPVTPLPVAVGVAN